MNTILATWSEIDPDNWSACDVECGGGTQTQARTCNDKVNGVNDCDGDDVLTKPCNTEECPDPCIPTIRQGATVVKVQNPFFANSEIWTNMESTYSGLDVNVPTTFTIQDCKK